MKTKAELTVEAVRKVIEEKKPASMTQLAHELGHKGNVSSSLTRKLRALLPDINALLASNKPEAHDAEKSKAAKKASKGKAKPAKAVAKAVAKAAKAKCGKGKLPPRHPQNMFREGSAYGVCFDLMAEANPDGMLRDKLIEALAKATGKDMKRASFDAQVVLSARGAAGTDLNPFEGPRNRSCRFGFWVERKNGHVRLVLPAAGTVAKE